MIDALADRLGAQPDLADRMAGGLQRPALGGGVGHRQRHAHLVAGHGIHVLSPGSAGGERKRGADQACRYSLRTHGHRP